MNKYKVCVYAISKNEEKFVERWVNSMKEADEIYVLDTGSTDNTAGKLKEMGVNVTVSEIKPWRFDVARNTSLDLVPIDTDICVCTDLDEIFEAGWREKLEARWNEKVDKVKYNYNWSFDEFGNPATTFFIEKIHRREGYRWHHPVHEVLNVKEKELSILAPEITLNHYPDKNKSRSSYLPLLELSVEECPEDDRNMHYLGREYMYYGKWNEAIETLKRHLNLNSSVWRDERAASMRFIARSYIGLDKKEEAKEWFEKAILEAPYLREGYVELANLYYLEENYLKTYELLQEASKIKEKPKTYINEEFCWNAYFYDLFSIVAYYLGKQEEAINYVKKAIELDRNNERLKGNLEIMQNKA